MAEAMTNAPDTDEDDGALFKQLKDWVRKDREAHQSFLEEAEECFRFIAGHQWDEETKRQLEEQRRAPVVFNRVAPIMRAVTGTEIASRARIAYRARELSDGSIAEIWSEALRWFRDESDAEDEETDAFLDAASCGLGWIETTLDFDLDPEGEPRIKRISPLEIVPDANAAERNLVDMTRVSHVKRMPLREARDMFPDFEDADLDASWIDLDDEGKGEPVNREEARRYASDDDEGKRDDDLVTVVRCQWRERVRVIEVTDPQSGQTQEMTPEEYERVRERAPMVGMPIPRGRPRRRMKYRQAFLGNKILRQTDAPFSQAFSFEAITGFRDQDKQSWYGLVRDMMDPQRYANKWLSTTMHIMSTGAKGGVFVEHGAVEDMREFEESYAKADSVTKVQPGAIQQGRITNKPVTQFPAGFYELMSFAVDSVRQISGVSEEMMGTREVDQPGVLEQQRRTQGMIMLNGLFSSLRRYRKRVGRSMLEMMQEYIDPQRLARILGPQYPQQAIQAAYQADVEYDVVVEEAPTSANQRELVWSLVAPMFKDLPPSVQMQLWDYSPFPQSVADKIKQGYQQELTPPEPTEEEIAMQRAEVGKVQSEIAENAANAAKDRAEAAKTEIEMMRLASQPQGAPDGASRSRGA